MQAWIECMNINLIGAMYCLQEAAKVMIQQQSGSIINMSSLMGIQGYPMRSAYVASKFALIGITETMARELGSDNVRVNALMPGAVSGANMDRILQSRAVAENRPCKRSNKKTIPMWQLLSVGLIQKKLLERHCSTLLILALR